MLEHIDDDPEANKAIPFGRRDEFMVDFFA